MRDEIARLRRELTEAIGRREWMVASTKAHELSERLSDVAALERS